jgi:hypothetical protein
MEVGFESLPINERLLQTMDDATRHKAFVRSAMYQNWLKHLSELGAKDKHVEAFAKTVKEEFNIQLTRELVAQHLVKFKRMEALKTYLRTLHIDEDEIKEAVQLVGSPRDPSLNGIY